jgi:hypothetical protein
MDKVKFFTSIRRNLFPGALTPQQVLSDRDAAGRLRCGELMTAGSHRLRARNRIALA